jgi:hypothetical protein
MCHDLNFNMCKDCVYNQKLCEELHLYVGNYQAFPKVLQRNVTIDRVNINLLKPTGKANRFNIQQLCVLLTLLMCFVFI